MKNKKFCYLDPEFPKNIFIALIFLKSADRSLIYPLFETFSNLNKLKSTIKKLKHGLEKNNEDTVAYGGIVVTLEYHHNFPLKKEYWEISDNPNLNRDIRMEAFIELFKGPYQFFWVAITPQSYYSKTKKWSLSNWLPIRITSTDDQIEALIKSSDQSVDDCAKSIGLYSVLNVQGLDIESGKLNQPQGTSNPEASC